MIFPSLKKDREKLHLNLVLIALMRRHQIAMDVLISLLDMNSEADFELVYSAMLGSRVVMEAVAKEARN